MMKRINVGFKMRRKGFTLIELLVVVSIIALLVSILMPALGRAREQAKRVKCAALLHGLGNGLNVYAADHEGYYPSYIHGHINPHDLHVKTADYLMECGLEPEDFMCPGWPPQKIESFMPYWANPDAGYRPMGYLYLVPHYIAKDNKTDMIPPEKSFGTTFLVDYNEIIHGPRKISDKLAKSNPLMVDHLVTTSPSVPTADTHLNDFLPLITHDWSHFHNKSDKSGVEISNQVFADGHVEVVPVDDIRARFRNSNGWAFWW